MRSRGKLVLGLLTLLSSLSLAFGPPVLTESDLAHQRFYPHQIEAIVDLTPPPVSAEGAIVADVALGQIVFEKDAHWPLPPASTTKIMTALVALEHGRLDETVTVQASALVGGAKMGLVAGEQLTLEDLLYGLLLRSGNDAAVAIAQHVGGSVDGFVEMMNDEAARLGLKNTHFANPHGLDNIDHYTSAYDLLVITRRALANPVFARIVATTDYTVGSHQMHNRNELLSTYPGADGVKTGTTTAAGECLVASATRDGHQIVAVVLGSQDRYADATVLLDYAFSGYAWVPLELEGNPLDRYRDGQGNWHHLVVRDQAAAWLPRWQVPLVRVYRQLEIADGVEPDQRVGAALFYVGDTLLSELPLYARD